MSEETQTPEQIAEAAAATAAAAAAAPASEELKTLTDEELESMTTEEITAHAEKFEAQVKTAQKQTPEQIKANQIARAKKVQERANSTTTAPEETAAAQKPKDVSTADVLTMAKNGIELGSPEQLLLESRMKQGVISNYSEGLEHVGVSAELKSITDKRTAESIIDENADAETQLKSKKEIIAQSRLTGEIPTDKDSRDALVEENLSRMPSLN